MFESFILLAFHRGDKTERFKEKNEKGKKKFTWLWSELRSQELNVGVCSRLSFIQI